MVAVIRELLSKDQVKTIAAKLFSAQFIDGSSSGGPLGKDIKKNTQVPPNSPQYREMADMVMGAMKANETLAIKALPRRILSPIFASYTTGNKYGEHIDAALMGPYPGMRTDLSITIHVNPTTVMKLCSAVVTESSLLVKIDLVMTRLTVGSSGMTCEN